MAKSQSANAQSIELDSIDWAILSILQVDATTPNKDVAARVGVAPSTSLERVRRMRSAGVITATQVRVNPRVAGRGEQAFLGIQIRPHGREMANDFVRKALAMPETVTLYNVSGTVDYLVHVAVADSTALQALVMDKILAIPQVAHCRTQLIFGEPWASPIQQIGI